MNPSAPHTQGKKGSPIRHAALAALALFCSGLPAPATTYVWNSDANGDWTTTTLWTPNANPYGRGHTADFSTLNITGNRTVTMNTGRDIGHLIFGDTGGTIYNWTLGGSGILALGPSVGQGTITVNNGTATINNRINNSPPAGLTGITKLGAGTVRFGYTGGLNGFGSGGLSIQEGTVEYASNSSNPFGSVVFNGGRLLYGFGATGLNQGGIFTVNSGNLRITGGTAEYRWNTADQLRGSGTLVVDGGGTLFISTNQNTHFTGTLSIEAGTQLRMNSSTMNSGTVNLASSAEFRIYSSTAAAVGRLTGTGTVSPLTGAASLTVGDNGVTPFSFGGSVSGSLNLTKTGSSTMRLTGANTYSGTTTVNGGILAVNGTHTGGGNYTISGTGTLGGTGTISSGTVTVNSGGTIAPGNSIGILTVPTLTLNSGSAAYFEISGTSTPGVDFDQIVGNTVNFSGPWTLQLEFLGPIAAGPHQIQIFDFNTYNGANAPTIEFMAGSGASNVSFDLATGILTFSDAFAIPEPGVATFILWGAAMLWLRTRRARS